MTTTVADTTVAEQLAFQLGAQVPAPARTWADARPGQRVTYHVPSSEWHGTWTICRVEPHPHTRNGLIVDLVDSTGRRWPKWADRRVAFPGPGFTEADHA